MRQFSSPGFRIWNLSLEAKVVYTGFGVLSLLALVVSALFYEDLVGHETAGVRAYYAGEAAHAPLPSPAANAGTPSGGGGPRIALPDVPDEGAPAGAGAAAGAPAALTVAVTYRKLLEVTHFHLFTVPVFLLIIAHLFMLTGLSQRAKVTWIAAGWMAALAHLAAPWLVRYGGAGWAFTYPWSGAALAVTTTVMTLYPVWAMWFGRPERSAASPASQA